MEGILLIVIIVLLIINSNNKNEIKKLKQQLYNKYYNNGYNYQNYPVQQNSNVYPQANIQPLNNNVQLPIQYNNIQRPIQYNNVYNEKKYSNKDIKNTLILITGSVLLILSAILFLATTWNSTNNILKSLVLLIMLGIFCATSYIADKYLKLKQTSKAFYYIALAYLPIVTLSFSVFGLVGSYFSITGPGKYVYLALSSFVVTIIYYYNSYVKKEKIVAIASVFSSIITILCICSIFSTNYNYLIFSMIIYGVLLNIFYKNKKYYFNENLHRLTICVFNIAIGIVLLFDSVICLMNSEVVIMCIINNILMFISFYYYLKIIVKDEKLLNILFPIYSLFISLLLVGIINIFVYQQAIVVFTFLILYGYDYFKNKKIGDLVYALLICSIIPLVIFSVYNNGIPCYLIILFYVLFSYFYHLFNAHNSVYPSLSFSILLMCFVFSAVVYNKLSYLFFGYSLLSIIIITMFIKKDYKLQGSLKYICNLSFLVASIISFKSDIFYIIMLLLYIVVSFVQCFKYRLTVFKVLSYIYFDILIMTLLRFLGIDSSNIYIISYSITGIVLMVLEYFIDKLKDKTNEIFIILYSIFIFILLCSLNNDISIIVMFVLFSLAFVGYIYYKKLDELFRFTPFLFIISFVYFSKIDIMYFVSFLLLGYFIFSIYNKKKDRFNVLYFIYTFMHIISFNEYKYISLLLVTIGICVNFIIRKNKTKDICKGLMYTCFLIFVMFFVYDINLSDICLFRFLPYMVWLLLVTRTVIKKYDISSCKILEYLGFIFINFLAFVSYDSEADGMLFVFALAIFVMVSYILKFGPTFIICLISILINVLLLTREFWLSLPWWLYILVIGTILVLFSINNEIHQKKEKSIISKLKDKVDL